MFGTNEIVGKKFFRDATSDTLMVTSIFFTLQGEGPYSGMPALFIRLAKCNLSCNFCFPSHYSIDVRGKGSKRLDQVLVGDEIGTLNDSLSPVYTKVLGTNDRWVPKQDMLQLTYVEQGVYKKLLVTKEHPFNVKTKGFVEASNLVKGDVIVHMPDSQRIGLRREEPPRQQLNSRLSKFFTDGALVSSVVCVKDLPLKSVNSILSKTDTNKEGLIKVTNFTCDGNNTFCLRGLHTHNCDAAFDKGDVMTFDEISKRFLDDVHEHWSNRDLPVPSWALDFPDEFPVNSKKCDFARYPGIVLVITGGEPLLQNNLTEFCRRQVVKFKAVQIESNGILDTELPKYVTLVCSPKCAEVAGVPTSYLKPSKTILHRADCLKFVMSADEGSPYNNVPDWAFAWKESVQGREVYVSPMNVYNDMPQKMRLLRANKPDGDTTLSERSTVDETVSFWEPGLFNMEKNQRNHEYTARYCMDNGLRFNMQAHLFASLA